MTADPHRHLELLDEASQRLVRTVDAFHEDDWAAPSGLPGWSRAHVVAHLVLNAEGLANALRGIVTDDPTPPMYVSQQGRDDDIEELARAERDEPRARLLAGCRGFMDAFAALPRDCWDEPIERVPGGVTFPARDTPLMRLREVEIHHADLDAGYSRSDWPPAFSTELLQSMVNRPWPTPFTGAAEDTGDTLHYGGASGPTVLGCAADLGWWLTGRGSGEGLSSSEGGQLPEVATW